MVIPDRDPSFNQLLELIISRAGSVRELAAATEVPQQTIQRWLNGNYPRDRRTENLDRVNAWARRHVPEYPPAGYPNGLIGIARAGPAGPPPDAAPINHGTGSDSDVMDDAQPAQTAIHAPEVAAVGHDAGRVPATTSGYELPTSPSKVSAGSSPMPRPPAPSGIGWLGLFLAVAVVGTVIASLASAALPTRPLTKPFSSSTTQLPPTAVVVAPPPRERYGCSDLTSLPATVDLQPQDLAPAAALTPSYDVNSAGTAVPVQLHPGGYMDQAFVATHKSISAIGTIPGIDFRVGPPSARLTYELWDLNGHRLATTIAPVDDSNANLLVAEPLNPPAAVQPGHVYFFRVINPDATPAVGMYVRSPDQQHLAKPFPVCLVDAEPPASPRARLSIQGDVLSGQIATN